MKMNTARRVHSVVHKDVRDSTVKQVTPRAAADVLLCVYLSLSTRTGGDQLSAILHAKHQTFDAHNIPTVQDILCI